MRPRPSLPALICSDTFPIPVAVVQYFLDYVWRVISVWENRAPPLKMCSLSAAAHSERLREPGRNQYAQKIPIKWRQSAKTHIRHHIWLEGRFLMNPTYLPWIASREIAVPGKGPFYSTLRIGKHMVCRYRTISPSAEVKLVAPTPNLGVVFQI